MKTQPEEALEAANDVKVKRAYLINWILDPPFAESRLRAGEVLMSVPPEIHGMRIDKFLKRMSRVGAMKIEELTEGNQINPVREIGELTDRQRRLLADQLRPGVAP